jgi:hypothetical protein
MAKQQNAMCSGYVNSMQHHILIHMESTYFNIDGVEKMGCTTWKQAPNQTLITECKAVHKPSCGSLKFSTSRKEKNNLPISRQLKAVPNTHTKHYKLSES